MRTTRLILLTLIVLACLGIFVWWRFVRNQLGATLTQQLQETLSSATDTVTNSVSENVNPFLEYPLAIGYMRNQQYSGSEFTTEQTVTTRNGYREMIVSYQSDGNKIYGLLTIPTAEPPEGGWPIIIFNHGYIPPEQYRTTERYDAYQDGFARAGYITFKSDYRGHGNSEGEPLGAYYSPGYTIDVLNGLASVQKLPEANPDKVGMWGHSLGGNITMRSLVISDQIDVAVIWGGVVSSYEDIRAAWDRRPSGWRPSAREQEAGRSAGNASSSGRILLEQVAPEPVRHLFWQAVDPTNFVGDIAAPVQLHHGQADETVDWHLSELFANRLTAAGKTAELHLYPGNDHNLSQSFSTAMRRSVEFFDTYLKQE